ncbi:Uncharacterized protein YpbB [Salinibacillus kushneri]|uniref:Uncharacterized protein YpbB n=1 Tax=Salinibacillus kushneri TaxID=237682 RepID=A0A1I0I0V6_9BACI|nr:helix-turn-helix domain-containing protein [Salinibacillus kushneri]SET89342.1 Uncharacterized protein YpbB [Salinibacillus kushneri]
MYSAILLKCITKLQNERSPSSIYHLLKGKRSSQTIQDAKAYGLSPFFGIYKTLSKKQFQNSLSILQKENLITWLDDDQLMITEAGRISLQTDMEESPELDWLDGFNVHHIAPQFWLRLLLWIQTGSNLLKDESHFIPVHDQWESVDWVRQFYRNKKKDLEGHFTNLYQELYSLLKLHRSFHADIVVSRLTGYKKIGLSKQQIAEKWKLPIEDVEMYIQSSIHFIVNKVCQNQSEFPALLAFIPEKLKQLPLTDSAAKTYYWLKQGYSIEHIAKKRRLKINTIQDHLIEITYVDSSFSIDSYVAKEDKEMINRTIDELNTKRLKVIKDHLPDSVSYFMIRMVMAKNYQ